MMKKIKRLSITPLLSVFVVYVFLNQYGDFVMEPFDFRRSKTSFK